MTSDSRANPSSAHPLRLYKKQKLCSQTAIDMLFGNAGDRANSRLAYPLRMVFMRNDHRHSDAPVQFLISIPKKRLRRAVHRVLMRRRVREAYRLTHQRFPLPDDCRVDVAFIYVAPQVLPYHQVQKAVERLLRQLVESQAESSSVAK